MNVHVGGGQDFVSFDLLKYSFLYDCMIILTWTIILIVVMPYRSDSKFSFLFRLSMKTLPISMHWQITCTETWWLTVKTSAWLSGMFTFLPYSVNNVWLEMRALMAWVRFGEKRSGKLFNSNYLIVTHLAPLLGLGMRYFGCLALTVEKIRNILVGEIQCIPCIIHSTWLHYFHICCCM